MQNVTIDRNKFIGGSDIPIIMGISPFKTRFELLQEKAGIIENTFEGNKYTEYGNVMEEKIRNYVNKIELSNKEYVESKVVIEKEGIRIHTDGFNEESVLEIKTTSQVHEKIYDYKVYLVQLLFYMKYHKVKKGVLAIYKRPNDFDEEFDENNLQMFAIDKSNFKELEKEIDTAVDQFKIDLEKIKNDPDITEEDLIPNKVIELSNQIVELENELVKMKEIETKQKELKSQLKEAMQNNNVKKWETPSGIKITLVEDGAAKEVEVFDEARFKEEQPVVYASYIKKETKKGRSGFIKITL